MRTQALHALEADFLTISSGGVAWLASASIFNGFARFAFPRIFAGASKGVDAICANAAVFTRRSQAIIHVRLAMSACVVRKDREMRLFSD